VPSRQRSGSCLVADLFPLGCGQAVHICGARTWARGFAWPALFLLSPIGNNRMRQKNPGAYQTNNSRCNLNHETHRRPALGRCRCSSIEVKARCQHDFVRSGKRCRRGGPERAGFRSCALNRLLFDAPRAFVRSWEGKQYRRRANEVAPFAVGDGLNSSRS
jgi:hypothetical protein